MGRRARAVKLCSTGKEVDIADYPAAVAEGVFAGLALMEQHGVPTSPK